MSDPFLTSRTARESLARGLSALQSDPSVPSHLVELAAPIAQAMGALHQLERTQELAPHVDLALGHLRRGITQLQAAPRHPAVETALEAVARSLSLVHALGKIAPAPAAPAPAAAPSAPSVAPAPAAAPSAPAVAPAPAAAPSAPSVAPAPEPKPATASIPVPSPPVDGDMKLVAAELGAHSASNFYKGLSGNDIVDHGGLFVSTYLAVQIGTPVRLRVSLPGGFEFEANAVVAWTRDQGGDAPPGLGVRFTAITTEARQLVYRYARNREPLFHDDL